MKNINDDFGKIYRNSVIQKPGEGFSVRVMDLILMNPAFKQGLNHEVNYTRWWMFTLTIVSSVAVLMILYAIFYTDLLTAFVNRDFFLNDIFERVTDFINGLMKNFHLSLLSVVILCCIPFFILIEQGIRYFSLRRHA